MKIGRIFRVSLFFGLTSFLCIPFYFLPVNAEIVDGIAAIVNDEIITLSDLNTAEQQSLLDETGSVPDKGIERKRLVLDGLIEKKLMGQAAKQFGISVSEEEVINAIEDVERRNRFSHEEFLLVLSNSGIDYEVYKKGIEAEILQAKFFDSVIRVKVTISEEELKEYYMEVEESFRVPSEVRLAQILFLIPEGAPEDEKKAVRDRAEIVLNMIRDGEAFEELSAKFSDGPGADTGGDLGYIKKGEMNPDIEGAVFELGVGEVSDLIETSLGIHIIKVVDIREEVKRRFPEVKNEIENIIFKKKTREVYKEWLGKMKARSYIEVKL
ncbi:MAG: peptidylprolyl isomerase [Thermodesulfobacteriota bacterium]